MLKLYQTKRFEVFSFLSGMALGLALILSEHVGAVTNYPPGSLLQPNDVTSSHIRNNTITGDDVSTSASFTFASSTISTLMSGTFTATSAATLPATTTINGVAYKWTNTQGATSTNLQNDGAGNLSWVSGGTTQLTTTYTAGEALNANDLVFIRNTPIGLTRDTSSTAAALFTGFTSALTVANQSNRLLLVHIHSDGGQALSGATCTYAGQSMTQLRNFYGPNTYNSSVYGILAPTTGANNISCTWGTGNTVQMKAVSYYGVEQSLGGITNATSSGTGTAVSGNITTTGANDWIVTFGGHDGSSTSGSGTNCTMVQTGASSWVCDTNGPIVSPASTAVTSTNGTSRGWEKGSFVIHQFRQAHDDVWRASASTGATASSTIGFALTSYATDTLATIVTQGVVTGFSGLTLAGQYYLGNARGTASTTPGTVTRKMGIGLSTTTMLITNSW